MKILVCAEFFYPSVGGVQEVIKQISRRLSANGHEVTVATSKLSNRISDYYGKIKIESFSISGNYVNGLNGEIERYRRYVLNNDYDILFIYAAQQWTFDALLDIFDNINAKKVFVPCGFSNLYNQTYAEYFDRLKFILKKFDSLIFHSKNYRDYIFAKKYSLKNLFLIPNAADNSEFSKPIKGFRQKNSIPNNETLLLTVGSLNGAKGHLEIAKAFTLLNYQRPVTLILNGNQMPVNNLPFKDKLKKINLNNFKRLFKSNLYSLLLKLRNQRTYLDHLLLVIRDINSGKYGKNKKVMLTDLLRDDLISCYFESDLFLFASKIEYSPLVIFEAAAAGLPFISASVGNVSEIIKWTKGGVLIPSTIEENGYTSVDVNIFSKKMSELLEDKKKLKKLGMSGRLAWEKKFNWDRIYYEYEKIFFHLIEKS